MPLHPHVAKLVPEHLFLVDDPAADGADHDDQHEDVDRPTEPVQPCPGRRGHPATHHAVPTQKHDETASPHEHVARVARVLHVPVQAAGVELRRLLQVEGEVATQGPVGGEPERSPHEAHQTQGDREVRGPGEQESAVEVFGPRAQHRTVVGRRGRFFCGGSGENKNHDGVVNRKTIVEESTVTDGAVGQHSAEPVVHVWLRLRVGVGWRHGQRREVPSQQTRKGQRDRPEREVTEVEGGQEVHFFSKVVVCIILVPKKHPVAETGESRSSIEETSIHK